MVLGLGASAAVAGLTLLLLLTFGHAPLLGWGTLWQRIVMSVGGGVATPICFNCSACLTARWITGAPRKPASGPDREIRRGRIK